MPCVKQTSIVATKDTVGIDLCDADLSSFTLLCDYDKVEWGVSAISVSRPQLNRFYTLKASGMFKRSIVVPADEYRLNGESVTQKDPCDA